MSRKLLALSALAALLGCNLNAAMGKELIYGSPLPPKHAVNVYGVEPLIKTLEKTVPIKLVAGGQLFGFAAALQSLSNRIADITAVVPSYSQSRLPNASMMFNAVMLTNNELVTQGAAEATILLDCAECKADYIRNKTIYLGGYAAGGMAFLCNKPVTKIEDMKGLKTRTSGAIGRWAAHFGAVPVSMTPGDMIEAINRGQIDCIAGFNAWYKSYPVRDSVKWIYSYPMGDTSVVSFMLMNLGTWKGLTLDQKKAVIAALPQASANIVGGYIEEAFDALDLAKKNGVTITNAGASLDANWNQYKPDEIKAIVAAAKKAGSKDPQRVIDIYLKNVEKWRKLIKDAGLEDVRASAPNRPSDIKGAMAKFATLLREHIYSKIDAATY